uniref:Uncharacterized protein n=1 Tax=Pyricularia oryzae (strain P131) TaxID=1143193 RepID=L7J5D8_PYRO1
MIYMRSYIWDSAYPFSLTTRPMNVRHQVRTKEPQHYYHVGKFRKP